jgi:hypothetical protein
MFEAQAKWIRLLIILAALPALGGSSQSRAVSDAREKIVLTAAERERLLSGMRTYLKSIEGIVEGLASNRLDRVRASALRSGKALLGDVDPALALAIPMSFSLMSLDTHEKFDALAARAAEKTPRSELLRDLGTILGNCTGCHATFRVVPAKQK